MVFAAASASMDLIGWQCVILDKEDCLEIHGWLRAAEFWRPGVVLAAAAVVPLIVVSVLALLSYRTTLRYESFRGSHEGAENGKEDPNLYSRRMWQGDLLVARLRKLHVGVGLVTISVILALPAHSLNDGAADILSTLALILAGAVLGRQLVDREFGA